MKIKKFKALLSMVMAAAMVAASGSFVISEANNFSDSVNEGVVSHYYAASSKSTSSKSTSSKSTSSAEVETTKMYVTGIEKNITMRDSDEKNGKVVAQLKLKDEVEVIDDSSETCYYVYYKTKKAYGYIKKEYLTDEKKAACKRQDAYIAKKTSLYATNDEKPKEIEKLNKNSAIFIVAKTSGDYWFIYNKSDKTFGYVKSMDISTSKSQSSSSTSSKSSTTTQTSKSSGSTSTGYYTGYGASAPSTYYQYYAYVNSGYLAIRSAKAYDYSNELGKIYTNQAVFVIDQSTGTYWYCYSPTTKMYGYVNSNYLLTNDEIIRKSTGGSGNSGSTSGSYSVWTVGNTGGGVHYLALRNAPAFDSSNEIGKLYDGNVVYVYSNSYSSYYDTYWYVYSPSLGKWGYVNSNYIWS